MAEPSSSFTSISRRGWSFSNGAWEDGPEGSLLVAEDRLRSDGEGMQGHHYSLLGGRIYSNPRFDFEFHLQPHSDAGIIFGATDPFRFHLIHFPNCGQASRAQNFWACLSRMDGSGYLRIEALELVRRVSSTSADWMRAAVRMRDQDVLVRIDRHGLFRARASDLPSRGRVGLYLFGGAGIRRLRVGGDECRVPAWPREIHPRRNWFHPRPETEYGLWQRPGELVTMPGGDIILHYGVQERPYSGAITSLITRSRDGGLSWQRPEPLDDMKPWRGSGPLHAFPDGSIRMVLREGESFLISESDDDGRVWGEPQPASVPDPPECVERLHLGPQPFINLRDGSVVMLAYGPHQSTPGDSPIYTWGSHHCQAYSSRSTDGGYTWSEWSCLDGTKDPRGESVPGSLDLTEACGVQTAGGRIMVLIRPIYSPWMWETWSDDGGRTWGPCLRGPFPGYATPNMLRTRSGRLLVAHRLPGCTVNISPDDGRTWDQGTMIDSAIWVMGSMMEVEDDLVLYVYWDSFESLMRAQLLRVTPEGLLPGR